MLRDFYYDGQIRKYLVQMMRILSHFQYQSLDTNGNPILTQIPVVYGDPSRQVATVINNNTENTTPVVPVIAVTIDGLKHDRTRIQEPMFVDTMQIRQRDYDRTTKTFTMNQGMDFDVQRLMPSPYILTLKAEIWSSNTDQKLQILEQIAPMYNMSFDVQSTDNYIDWTSLTTIFLEDVSWTSRTVPIGTDNPIDIAALTFTMPIWIATPAKVSQMGIIQKIIASIYQDDGSLDPSLVTAGNLLSRQKITPLQFNLTLMGNVLTLYKQGDVDLTAGTLNPPQKLGTPDNWHNFINMYGALNPGVSQIIIAQPNGGAIIAGTIAYNPLDDTKLIFNVIGNTLPVNTLPAIDAVINPQGTGPGMGTIPAPAVGQSYMLIKPLGSSDSAYQETAWGGAIANENDIITYNGTEWIVTFNSEAATEVQYVTNLTTTVQYRWNVGDGWTKSVDGFYPGGDWSVFL